MKAKTVIKASLFFLLLIFLVQSIVVLPGCANIIPPMGGLRDSLPPRVISIKPADSTKNFTENRIVFSFDEYVEIQDVQKNLIVSPVPKVTPNVERKLSTVIVKLRDTLQPNTTYTLDFGNSIKDLNEGNILKNFAYVFTTGTYFDSLQLRGKVILAKDASVDTTLTVMLHANTWDSAIVKEKHRYVTKVDKNGNFR
ncbi:MAG: Ig-like domain-containing protein, partial [Bacteroidota bacterium]